MKSQDLNTMESDQSNFLIDILNGIKGKSIVQELINQHVICKALFFIQFNNCVLQRQELAELQAELEKRLNKLSENKTSIVTIDEKLVNLLDEQIELSNNKDDLKLIKNNLKSRTEQQLLQLEQRKQS